MTWKGSVTWVGHVGQPHHVAQLVEEDGLRVLVPAELQQPRQPAC
jgi:hypothetical protein